ncbi:MULTISPECIES: phage tail protein [unclassified Pseudomonas]|uniref:phage tail protein n=1 Tax=unclassified Pseudomonas TaxID=196821 RepID=UPI002448FC13|nr:MULTISPECIES: phage tail protein [unclassified Pseudomonas]MDH0301243.1 phage tail protein [Pseudomonas sp. GD04091]MDH1984687.1 phage tail protein [Pseudomonas sp. GD03689]
MTDQNSQFFAILTAIGEAKQANADALGIPWKIFAMGVGDANGADPIPRREQTMLIGERRRAPLNQLKVDPANPNIIIAEQVIPPDVGGWWIREIGLYDIDGDLIAVANCAPSFKPLLSQGTGKTQVVRLNLIVTSSANIQLKIDPSVVLATREYVDSAIIAVLPKGKVAGTYTQVRIDERGIVQEGKNPTKLHEYGIDDALPIRGGTLKGNLFLDQGWSVAVTPADSESWAAGVHVADPEGTIYASLGFWGNKKQMRSAYLGLGPTAWATGNGVRVTPLGVNVTGALTASLSPAAEVPFATISGRPVTLDGYGVPLASKDDAEGGTDNEKPMSALRVRQAISKVLVQATEAAFGWLKIATQAQIEAGTDDTTAITPKKARFGFQILKGSNGYIVLPKWLGGLIIQWGVTADLLSGTIGSITHRSYFPIQFPNGAFTVLPVHVGTSEASSSAVALNLFDESSFLASFENKRADQSVSSRWIAIGS